MHRTLLLIPLLLVSTLAYSWECPEEDKYNQPIEHHMNIATDVIFGRVVEGKYDESLGYSNNIQFKVSIHETFKGALRDNVNLTTSYEDLLGNILLGENYIFFLYDRKSIDFCGVIFELGSNVDSIESLIDNADRSDVSYAKDVSSILETYGRKP